MNLARRFLRLMYGHVVDCRVLCVCVCVFVCVVYTHQVLKDSKLPVQLATSLRKFIVNRCSELERKYKTMEKTVQLVTDPFLSLLKNKFCLAYRQLAVVVKKQSSQSPPAEKKVPRIKMRLLSSSSSSKKPKYSSTDIGSER